MHKKEAAVIPLNGARNLVINIDKQFVIALVFDILDD